MIDKEEMTFLELANLIISIKALHKVKINCIFDSISDALSEISDVNKWTIENILSGNIDDIDNIAEDL